MASPPALGNPHTSSLFPRFIEQIREQDVHPDGDSRARCVQTWPHVRATFPLRLTMTRVLRLRPETLRMFSSAGEGGG